MANQRRPAGPYWPTPPKWKTWITRVMVEKGVTQADLHRATGASTTAISDLFKDKTKQSRLVPKIHKALGLDPPTAPAPKENEERDELLRELIDAWAQLVDEDRDLLIQIARRARTRSG
jgi:transcriptional regulator with XRE-family HTH domain